jgi:hypothetical protein
MSNALKINCSAPRAITHGAAGPLGLEQRASDRASIGEPVGSSARISTRVPRLIRDRAVNRLNRLIQRVSLRNTYGGSGGMDDWIASGLVRWRRLNRLNLVIQVETHVALSKSYPHSSQPPAACA